jgi:hypothetical protein
VKLIMHKRIKKSGSGNGSGNGNGKNKERMGHIKLKVCSKTKKQQKKKCTSNFCEYDDETKQCYLDMNNEQLEYYCYLIGNDILNNKLEAQEIIKGSFIPEFNMRNKIFRTPDEITINLNELASIIETGIYSKYKQNITLSEYINTIEEYQFTKNDYTVLENTNIEQFKRIMNTIITDVVDLSIKNIFIDDKIFTTPFDKTGTYDTTGNIGECKFPFFDKNKKKYVYQCLPKAKGVMCPTKTNFNRVPDKWGYCPEKIDETKKRLNVIEIDTDGDNKDYYPGKCLFPFMVKDKDKTTPTTEPIYKLKYDCIENNEEQYSWCPLKNPVHIKTKLSKKKDKTSVDNGVDDGLSTDTKRKSKKMISPSSEHEGYLLRSADNFENVHLNNWYDGKLSITGITAKKHLRGYCRPPPLKTKKKTGEDEKDDAPELTLDNYIPNNCSVKLTPSKGGYKRPQLFNFGVNHLKIPYTKLMKNADTQLDKDEMCKVINNKYREIKTQGKEITDQDRLNAYAKKIELCEKGESKGGYSLKELREIGINYFDLDEPTANNLGKEELCQYIRKRINKIITSKADKEAAADIVAEDSKGIDDNNTHASKISRKEKNLLLDTPLSYEYPADINLCKETPNRGGPGSTEIKDIARDNFGIDTKHKHKDQLCDEIEGMLKKGRPQMKKQHARKNTHLNARKLGKIKHNFDELFEHPEHFELLDDADTNTNLVKPGAKVDTSEDDFNNEIDEIDEIEDDDSQKFIDSTKSRKSSGSSPSLSAELIDNE